jgi:hypothetical protein
MERLRDRLYDHSPYAGFDLSRAEPDLQGWGSDHPILRRLVHDLKPPLIIEVGSWKGRSAVNMARYGLEVGLDLELLCVDSWLGSPEHWLKDFESDWYRSLRIRNGSPTIYDTFLRNVIEAGLADVITPFRVPSATAFHVLDALHVRARLIYLDAGHEEDAVRGDLDLYMRLLAADGVLCGDDYGTWPGVTRAVQAYCAAHPDVNLALAGDKFLLSRADLSRFAPDATLVPRPGTAPEGRARRTLIAIPHFYEASPQGRFGSTSEAAEARAASLARCIAGLHQSLGRRQGSLNIPDMAAYPANTAFRSDLDIVICTTGDKHLLDRLGRLATYVRHERTDAEPMMLGFECHRVLAQSLGHYDVYGYMEDDLVVRDPLFLDKILWFAQTMGQDCLLQPQRYEVGLGGPLDRFYIDGDLRPDLVARFARAEPDDAVAFEVAGQHIGFRRARNPHSGCFFLTDEQMRSFASRPDFLDRDTRFVGPLESAATLGILKAFRIFKSLPETAGFLEIEHPGSRYLSLVGRTVRVPQG